jgi:hypothetical protein
MEIRTGTGGSTLKEWSNFLTVLNSRKNSGQPLLRKAASPLKIVDHLEMQFVSENTGVVFQNRWYTVTKVKRKKILPGQLSIWQ